MTSATDDHDDIRRWLERHRDAWNADDVDALFIDAAPDLHWVNVVGMHWQGLQPSTAAHRALFAIMFNGVSLTLVAIESVVAIGSEVRIAVVRWHLGDYVVPTGETIRDEENRMTLIFSGTGDTLRLRHVANVRIDRVAAKHDPVASPTR